MGNPVLICNRGDSDTGARVVAMPDLKDGFTRIANELLTAIIAYPFSKRQMKVMLAIIRRTYGFGKKEDDVTITTLADDTGLARPHASAAVRELERIGAITKRVGRYGYIIGVNKNYMEWGSTETKGGAEERLIVVEPCGDDRTETVHVPKQSMDQNSTPPVPKQSAPRTETVHTIETPQKTIPKRKESNTASALDLAALPADLSPQVWADWLKHRKSMKRPMETQTAVDRLASQLRKAAEIGWSADDALGEAIERGWVGLKADWLQNASRRHQQQRQGGGKPAMRRSGFSEIDHAAEAREMGFRTELD